MGLALAFGTNMPSVGARLMAVQIPAAESLIEASDCASCHDADRAVVGPSYVDVAVRYRGQDGAAEEIMRSIRDGGSGRWGDVRMTPHPDMTDAEIESIVRWILALDAESVEQSSPDAVRYTYVLEDGASVELDFPVYVEDQAPIVTRDVFNGYLLYNSYCFRCHGQDATESQLAPDLKRSFSRGMTGGEFLAVTMAGRGEDAMPSWAGFLTEAEVRNIYMYVQGRTLGLVPVGRPPSDY